MKITTTIILLFLVEQSTGQSYCDEQYTDTSGFFRSPEYPNSYPAGVTCNYNIKVDAGRWIFLRWNYFNMDGKMPDCLKDYVEVYTGCGSYNFKISRFCSNNMIGRPHNIYSKDNCMKIVFHSKDDGSSYYGGFSVSYWSYPLMSSSINYSPVSKVCSRFNSSFPKTSGVITSPNWPHRSFSYIQHGDPPGGTCEWDIYPPTGNKVIQYNFMDIDMTQDEKLVCSSTASLNYVKVREGDDRTMDYCKVDPFSLTPPQSTPVQIIMRINSFYLYGRGLAVGYVIYTHDEHNPVKSPIWWKVGTVSVASIFLFVLCLFCFYRRFKRRAQQPVYRNFDNDFNSAANVTEIPFNRMPPTYQLRDEASPPSYYQPHMANAHPQVQAGHLPPQRNTHHQGLRCNHVENDHPPPQGNTHQELPSNRTEIDPPQQSQPDCTDIIKSSLARPKVYLDNVDEM